MKFEKFINDVCMGIVFNLVNKKTKGPPLKYKEELSQSLKMTQMSGDLT